MIKIAFAGAKGSGKNTAAEFLSSFLGKECHQLSFADPIKKVAQTWLGMTSDHTDGFLKETPCRFLVQPPDVLKASLKKHALIKTPSGYASIEELYGKITTKCFKHFEIDLKCDTLLISPRAFMQQFGTEVCRSLWEPIWVDVMRNKCLMLSGSKLITDLRFPNELEFCRSTGFVVVHVERNELRNQDTHVSEKSLEKSQHDYVLENNGTVYDLLKSVEIMKNQLIGLKGVVNGY